MKTGILEGLLFVVGDDGLSLKQIMELMDISKEEAYNLLNDFYKGKKKIHQIESRKILVAGGNIHCITMQIGKEN